MAKGELLPNVAAPGAVNMAIWRKIISTDNQSYTKFYWFLLIPSRVSTHMSQEIELKFIVDATALSTLRTALNNLNGEHTPAQPLANTYYETPDLTLRNHGMGLRIRGNAGQYEMTMKTAGTTIGGLHQHPEFNVALDNAELALEKFPADMWPEGVTSESVAASVQPLFSTHFEREKWVVAQGESRIEIALDLGEIQSGDLSEPLCELELELLEGNRLDIITLAQQLAALPGLRTGSLSKAARGYHLAKGNPDREIKPLTVMPMVPKSSVERGMMDALALALSHWQYHEELWVRGDDEARIFVAEGISLARQIFTLFGGMIPRKASTHLRDGLTQCEAALASGESAQTLAYSSLFTGTRLMLIEWLLGERWRSFVDAKAQAKLDGSFKRFADTHLSRHAAELKQTFTNIAPEHYRDQLPRLARNLDSIRLLAGAYEAVVVNHWLSGWEDLRYAIERNQRHEANEARHDALDQPPFWLHSGKA